MISNIAFYVLSANVLLGITLALLHLRATEPAQLPKWQIGAVHGLAGAIGLGLLLLTSHTPGPAAHGVGPFRSDAAVLFTAALAAGGAMLLLRCWRGKPSSLLIGLHGTIAIGGYIMLLAFRSLR